MMRAILVSILLALCLSSCESILNDIVTTKELIEFENDSTFEINRFVSRLPIVVLQTEEQIPDYPRLQAKMGIINNGGGRYNRIIDDFTDFEGSIRIERRGSTSQNFPKQQYAFETQDAELEPFDVDLLGLPKDNDWILYAPYSDKSMIRNVLMYKWWRDLDNYTSRTRFCEVVLNGKYQGIYILMEQIKWAKERVDIERMSPTDNQGDSLTGGYIIKVDKTSGGKGGFDWKTEIDTFNGIGTNVSFQFDYPKKDEITVDQSRYMQDFMHDFEKRLYDDSSAYAHFVDPLSFIDFFIMQEIAHNVDGYRNSTFLHKKRNSKGGKLHAGPIWDFNLALGNTNGCEGELAEGWALDHPCDPSVIPFWWKRMEQDPIYAQQLRKRWWELRKGVLSDKKILADIDKTASELGESVARNDMRWKLFGVHIWPNNFVGETYEEEIEYLKDWILMRLKWMDANIPKPE